jgi:hypothetical protein
LARRNSWGFANFRRNSVTDFISSLRKTHKRSLRDTNTIFDEFFSFNLRDCLSSKACIVFVLCFIVLTIVLSITSVFYHENGFINFIVYSDSLCQFPLVQTTYPTNQCLPYYDSTDVNHFYQSIYFASHRGTEIIIIEKFQDHECKGAPDYEDIEKYPTCPAFDSDVAVYSNSFYSKDGFKSILPSPWFENKRYIDHGKVFRLLISNYFSDMMMFVSLCGFCWYSSY